MSQPYRVTKNVVYNFLSQFATLTLGLIFTPYIIHTLGNGPYGILSVVTVFIGYLAILDLGLADAVIKRISEFYAKGDLEMVGKIVRTALTIYLITGTVGAIILFVFAGKISSELLKVPADLIPVTTTVLYISGVGFLINMLFSVFNSVPNALQRMDLVNIRNVVIGSANTLGTVALLLFGKRLEAVVVWDVLTILAGTVWFYFVFRRLLPQVKLSFGFERDAFKQLASFSVYKFIGSIAGPLVFQLDRILIGVFYPVALLAYYAPAVLLGQKASSVISNFNQAVFPAISESHAQGDLDRARRLYLQMTKSVVFLMWPITLLLFIFADQIFSFWLGADFAEKSAPVLRILAMAYFIASLSAPGVVASEALGRPSIAALFSSISAVINIAAALYLIPRYGLQGAAWASMITFSLQTPLFVLFVNNKLMGSTLRELLQTSYLRHIGSGLIAMVASYPVTLLSFDPLWILILGFSLFGIIYILVDYLIGGLDERELAAIRFIASSTKKVFIRKV